MAVGFLVVLTVTATALLVVLVVTATALLVVLVVTALLVVLVVGHVQEQAGALVVIGLAVVFVVGLTVVGFNVVTAWSVGRLRNELLAATGELRTNRATSLFCR